MAHRHETAHFAPLIWDIVPDLQLSEIIEAHIGSKIPMAEIKNFCHLLHHLQHRMNTSVPAKSGYIYIFLLLCIYIEVFSRGCVYFSERANFNNLTSFRFFWLALPFWKIHRYPATFCCTLAFMRSSAWRTTSQNYLGSPFLTFHTFEVQ